MPPTRDTTVNSKHLPIFAARRNTRRPRGLELSIALMLKVNSYSTGVVNEFVAKSPTSASPGRPPRSEKRRLISGQRREENPHAPRSGTTSAGGWLSVWGRVGTMILTGWSF